MKDPQDEICVIARSCQHEVYKGDYVVWFDGRELCPECFREEIERLDLEQLANVVGAELTEVRDV